MVGLKKPLRNFEIALFAWLIGGLAPGVILVPTTVEPLVVDDSVQINEGSQSDALNGASPPSWPCASDRGTWNTPLLSLFRLSSSLAAKDILAGAIFRLRLVRLHPSIGPP